MTISKKQLLPTSTSLQSRVRIFQATRRPKYMEDDTSTTAWGSVRVMGKLGQAHADVLESILFCAEDVRKKEGFGTKLLVDPYLIRKHSNIGSGEQMEKIMNELMAAVLTISTTGGKHNFTKGHIIESMIESKTADSINKLTGGNRKM